MPETFAHLRALKLLQTQAAQHDAVLVAFSGGKDSLAVMDLCVRSFRKVVGFFMYLVPGLACVDAELEAARARWGVECLHYPHFGLADAILDETYRPTSAACAVPRFKPKDVFAMVQADTGIELIAHGAKASDYASRATIMRANENLNVIHPLAQWNKFDVLAYLRLRGIPLPPSSGRATTGIGLAVPSLCWLHDTFPDDFARLEKVFPYARCAIHRRDFFDRA